MIELDLHPLCALFPRLEGVEFDALKADIAANGQRAPIVIHDGQILDGGNRYRACVELGIEPVTTPFDGADLLAYVLSLNLHRRHLSPGQQAAIVAAATDWLEAYSHGGDRKSAQSATLHLETVAARAAQSGASVRTQKMADKVARTDPALAKRVAHGEVSLPAAVRQVEGAANKGGTPKSDHAEAGSDDENRRDQSTEESSQGVANPETPDNPSELDTLREAVQELAHELEQVTGELSAYRAAESGDGEKKLVEQQKEIARLKTEVRRLTERRDSLMNENAELKREVKSLSRKIGRPARG
ncbi:ParB N-terminal domain-containing protein [Burkholderia glumae]|uniref:ParB N-terminal domain-containing protein n=1 Tax=Burkholderia glumae TaxID=337 RepID=UPI002036F898|nr:ParB N-terminal domain-containing protein [Burkholderia glumae]MCM2544867.1 ParB N-terminal domain-containing protein [Burkholderia glumae]